MPGSSIPPRTHSSADPNARGDLVGELRAFLDAGIDGFFTDNPAIGAEVVR
jgi:glycerophosphoryl diester phosphodiesterase